MAQSAESAIAGGRGIRRHLLDITGGIQKQLNGRIISGGTLGFEHQEVRFPHDAGDTTIRGT